MVAIYQPGRGSSPGDDSGATLISDLPDPRTVRQAGLLFRPPSLSLSGQVVRQTSAPIGSGHAPSALSLPQGPAALTPWCLGTTDSAPGGYQAQLLCIASPGGTQSCPLGEILPGILQIWNCSALISLFQLACLTLAPRVGPCLAVSQHWRGLPLSSTGISRPQRRAGSPRAPCSPQGWALWPEDLLLLFSRPAVLPSFLALHLACGPSLKQGGPMGTHSCPVLHCDPFPHPHSESGTGGGGGQAGGVKSPQLGAQPAGFKPCSIAP